MKPGDLVKLNVPDMPVTYGQGEPPEGITIVYPNEKYFLQYGGVFKLSETCDPKNKIADLSVAGYPLIHIDFVTKHNKQFTLLK